MHQAASRSTDQKAKRRGGIACVEFALILPILLSFVLGVLEVGRFIEVRQILMGAAREGARQASTGMMTDAQVITVVTGYVQSAGLPTNNLVVTVEDLTNAGTDVSQATTLDNLLIRAQLPYSNVRWSTTSFFVAPTTTIESTAIWPSGIPYSYPGNVTAPTGS
jgi:Flp pilus assembly protein TadG